MARRFSKDFEHGSHVAEFVDEMPPLGEDRKTIFVPDMDVVKMAETNSRTLGMFLAEILTPLAEQYGDGVWQTARKALYEVGRRRAEAMRKRMKIDDLNDARCLGRILDLEDSGGGIYGEWVEWDRKRAVKRDYECPQAKPYGKCPQICTVLLEAMEEGTFDALGVRLKKPIVTKAMTLGEPYCEVVIELED